MGLLALDTWGSWTVVLGWLRHGRCGQRLYRVGRGRPASFCRPRTAPDRELVGGRLSHPFARRACKKILLASPSANLQAMSPEPALKPRLPPRWFVRTAWKVHRALYTATGGRFGLRDATASRWGMLRLTTTGRRTGQERSAILGYVEDGPNLILLAMNGWADPDPAWLLNLKAHPAAKVDLVEGPRAVIARLAAGDERSRLWERWDAHGENLASYAGLRSRDTQVVILEPPPT